MVLGLKPHLRRRLLLLGQRVGTSVGATQKFDPKPHLVFRQKIRLATVPEDTLRSIEPGLRREDTKRKNPTATVDIKAMNGIVAGDHTKEIGGRVLGTHNVESWELADRSRE